MLFLTTFIILKLLISSTTAQLHYIPLSRRPVSAVRAFSHHNRPWFPNVPNPVTPLRERLPNTTRLRNHPLFGNIATIGEYYTTLYFGGQPINVQVDTGSSTIAVPLKQCRNCRSHDHRLDLQAATGTAGYIPCASSACRPNVCGALKSCSVCSQNNRACCSLDAPKACGFFLLYADRSGASGALIQADVAMAQLTVPLIFGAILRETEQFENQNVDGILGMAYSSLACNPTCVDPLFDTLVKTGKVERDIFSICTAADGGTITLGGSSPDFYKGKLQYVPLSHGAVKHFYRVDVKQVSIGGKRVRIPNFSNAIVDSGTTVLVLAPSAYNAIKGHFQENYCKIPGLCPSSSRQVEYVRVIQRAHFSADVQQEVLNTTYRPADDKTWFNPGYCARLTDEYIRMLPDIVISLNGVDLVLDSDTYMLRYEQQSTFAWETITYRCLGLSPLEGLQHMENNAILGNTVLIKYFVEYDRENDRVGFAVSKNCVDPSKTVILESPKELPKRRGLPTWIIALLSVACVAAWISLIVMCVREARSHSGYTEIPRNSRNAS